MSWTERCHEAAALFEQGEYSRAAAIFEEICADESIGQSDRAMMYLNLARTCEKLGSKLRVIKAYEQAASLAISTYLYVQTTRAQWLLSSGQPREALAVLEQLSGLDGIVGDQRKRLDENIQAARGYAIRST
jgi:tetratricopeptide (TPR) repeat protein